MPRSISALLLTIALLFAPAVRADALDTVLDVMYKAGVIDGNVKAAKPLIACLAGGESVQQCAAGNAGQTELAQDPQVKNVIDIYLAFNDQDYYTVLKKAGITVGCALIPGGEVKDLACGELGKIAAQVLDGVGSVLGAVGSFVTSVFGGGSDPPPMSPQDYYRLNYMPWLHWSVVHQLDNDTPANNQVLNAPVPACVNYFYHHTYSKADANKVCGDMRTWLANAGLAIGNAFRDEKESYFQLHFAPKLYEWANQSFKNQDNINIYAKQAMNSCVSDERQHLPLPNPGYDQCVAMNQSFAGMSQVPGFAEIAAQMHGQCLMDAQARSVPADDDAYTRICKPMTNRIIGQVMFVAMADLKSRMDKAAAAGCPNNGYPESVHCNTYSTRAACVASLPDHPAMCALDYGAALAANREQIWAVINTADAPCTAFGDTQLNLACPHPTQQMHCVEAKHAIEDQWGAGAVAGITCDPFEDPSYEQRKQQAQAVLAAVNASYGAPSGLRMIQATPVQAQPQARPVLRPVSPIVRNTEPQYQSVPAETCWLDRHDPLVIRCAADFQWDAVPARADAVYAAVNADNTGRPRPVGCLPDVDNDGAEFPCLATD